MEFKRVLPLLKNHLKAKKLTYRDLAKRIGASESAVKKLFTGQDCSFNRLARICEILGVSMAHVLALSEEVPVTTVPVAAEVQAYFQENINCFYFYWLLVYEGLGYEQICKKFSLSAQRADAFLADLARLNLVRLNSAQEVDAAYPNVILWEDKGPFVDRIKREWSLQTLESALTGKDRKGHLHLRSLNLRRESFEAFLKDLSDLLETYHKRAVREGALQPNRAEHFRFVAAAAPGSFVRKIGG